MRRLTVYLFAFALALPLVPLASAQQPSFTVPNLIRYGGTLKDAQGAPLSASTVGVTFAIYRQQEGGAPVWMETQNVTSDAAGNYNVLLGATTASGLPGDLFSQQEQRWLAVQVQGQPEQPRVMMVSVPYAFKAHEAETLAGRSVTDFVLATGANSSAAGNNSGQPATTSSTNSSSTGNGGGNNASSSGPTNFTGSTTDQIVAVTQSGTGAGVKASAPTLGISGTATDPTNTAYGVQGVASGTAGVGLIGTATSTTGSTYGLRGTSSSSSGTGVRGIATATSGSTIGVSGYVDSTSGTAAVFNNAAGGKILVGQNNGATRFTVDGVGNVNAQGQFVGNGAALTGIQFSQLVGQLASSQLSGTYSNAVTLSNSGNAFTGSGSGLTGIPFANLTGTLASAQLSGTYSNAVTLSNTSNNYFGNGSNLTGLAPAMGSANYIQNQNTAPQHSANFDISGNGTLGSYLTAYGGVSGIIGAATGNAVYGSATTTTGTTNGVYGQSVSPAGTGVYGANTATSGNAYGITGKSASTTGVGVYGWATSTTGNDSGMVGQSDSTTEAASGVFGVATAHTGQVYGVVGSTNSTSQNASGVYGNTTAATGPTNGVFGLTNSSDGNADGVYGHATSTSGGANGVVGLTNAPNGYGVWGTAASTDTSGFGYGVYGTSANGVGVYGQARSSSVCAAGVVAYSASTCSDGVYAVDTATSGNANGLYAQTDSAQGVAGFFNNGGGGYILVGIVNGNGTHMFHVDGAGDGYFAGDLNVGGTLTKGGGSFKIDDPLDPENKTLSHSFVESPDMMNIYNGIARLDARGEAWIELPQYFDALNRDFRYQLTSVGASQPRLYIAREVTGNRFKIAGGKPNAKVSWQVTGIRQDAWANAHRIPNEEDKPQEKRGTYLYPDLYGAASNSKTNAMLQH